MNASIKYLTQKIKGFLDILENKDIFTILIIVLVAFLSFGLGRLSRIEESRVPIKIENTAAVLSGASKTSGDSSQQNNDVVTEKMYVASINGGSYHFPWCSGAKRIKEANKIWFASKKDAEKTGYKPARNCKGL